MALEKYDPETGTARKNDIMRHRVLLPRPVIEHAEDPEDALAICMDRHAQVRLDVIAGAARRRARSRRPATGSACSSSTIPPRDGWCPPRSTCPGTSARSCARPRRPPRTTLPARPTSTALTEVIPPDLGPAEIEARLGAVFITPAEVQQFLRETLADESVTVTLAADGTWSVTGGNRHSVAATITWGTDDRDALSLAEHLLNRGGPIEVTRRPPTGRPGRTRRPPLAAREKQAELSDRFAGWVWEDLDRAGEVCRRYNDTFNAIVLRSYDDVQLSLPGVNRDISLFWWQKAAIARMIYEPTAGLFHDMGAGKTLEQIIGVMEQKRLGLIRKPVICVKNHLLDQFRDEFLWAYPQARILCADTQRPGRGGAAAVHRPVRSREPGRDHHDPRGVRVDPADPRGPRSLPGLHEADVRRPRGGRHGLGQGRGDAAGRIRGEAARLLRPRLPEGRTGRGRGRAGPQAGQAQGRAGPGDVLGTDGRRLRPASTSRRTSTTCGFPPTSREWRSASPTGPSTWR